MKRAKVLVAMGLVAAGVSVACKELEQGRLPDPPWAKRKAPPKPSLPPPPPGAPRPDLAPDKVMLKGAELAQALADTAREAEERAKVCDKLENSTVGWPEERAIGSAIAIALAQKSKGALLVDKLPSLDPRAIKSDLEGKKKVALPSTPKNDLTRRVAVMGRHLASYSRRPDINWTFGVLDDPSVNAYSAPGGYVFVTTGLLQKVDNEAQLAGVIAHEIGHVTSRHALNAYSKIKAAQCNVAVRGGVYLTKGLLAHAPDPLQKAAEFANFFSRSADGNGGLDLDGKDASPRLIAFITDHFVDTFISKGLAKVDEFEADRAAFEIMIFAGFDGGQLDKFIHKLPDAKGVFANHPSNKDRLGNLKPARADLAGFAEGGAAPPLSPLFKTVGSLVTP